MEAVGQLTGALAHDFNNLLTGMMGSLELLQSRVTRGRLDDLDRFSLAPQGAGRRAAALTQRLLAFLRRQTLDPSPTDVNRMIAGMEDMLRFGAAGLWTAIIDGGQLENALLNLRINARGAMPNGGRLTIETANKWLDDRGAKARDLPPAQYLSICVTDTGTGMSAETMSARSEYARFVAFAPPAARLGVEIVPSPTPEGRQVRSGPGGCRRIVARTPMSSVSAVALRRRCCLPARRYAPCPHPLRRPADVVQVT